MLVALSRFCEKWPERRRPAEDPFLAKRKNVDVRKYVGSGSSRVEIDR